MSGEDSETVLTEEQRSALELLARERPDLLEGLRDLRRRVLTALEAGDEARAADLLANYNDRVLFETALGLEWRWPGEGVWTVRELAEAAGVDGSQVRRALLAGKLDGFKPGQRLWVIPDSEARRWLAARKTKKLFKRTAFE